MQTKNNGHNYIDPIEKDDLIYVARNLENLEWLLGDVTQDYFSAYDANVQEDRERIVYEFERYKHYLEIAYDLLFQAVKELHEKDIWCYERKGEAA